MSSNVTGKLIGGRRVRWDDERAADAYARGWWVRGTLADSLVEAAQRTPQRIVLIDGECQMDCRSLYEQASALAQALLARMPTGSVVSLMLPNWHEAAIIYLAATMAGMVVNPILPSLRDRELLFILKDADTRMIFVPSAFRTARLRGDVGSGRQPDGFAARGRRGARRRDRCLRRTRRRSSCRRWIPMRCG